MFTWRRVSGFLLLVALGIRDDAMRLWRERDR